MESLFRFTTPPSACGYLPDQKWELEYVFVSQMTAVEYQQLMENGWRRFGFSIFHPVCSACRACHSLRILVDEFKPNRSQKRAFRDNKDVRLEIGTPTVSEERLNLFDRYHAFQSDFKGWPGKDPKEPADYQETYVDNPFPTEEWCYYIEDRLIGVGYVDVLPESLSAIYFFYEPELRDRSLGTFNVQKVLQEAFFRGLKYVYLGFFVPGCRSLEYKANFAPNELRDPLSGQWKRFRDR